jgi:two-component sensor histidine kinase
MDMAEAIKRSEFGSENRSVREQTSELFPNFTTVREALGSAQIGIWSWDVESGAFRHSNNFAALHDVSPTAFDGGYASFLGTIAEEDRAEIDAALQQAVRNRTGVRARYRIAHRADERWLEISGTVVSVDRATKGMLGLCCEVTERVNLETELRDRIRQQETLVQLAERALVEPNLDRLLNDTASTVALTLAVEFVKILELLPGDGDLLLRAGFGWKSDLTGSVLTTAGPNSFARFIFNSGAPTVIDDFAEEHRFEVPAYLKEHKCRSGVAVTIAGRDGRAYGILGICAAKRLSFRPQEISFLVAVGNLLAGAIQRGQLEQRHELMIRDMRHRSGNLFSQLLALFSQTARTSKGIPDLTGKYQARVLAMANAHRLITEGGWKSIPIMELLYVILGPYLDRVSFEGPNFDLDLDPVFHLSAALHELAANAIKHGSLSRPKGQLELRWSVNRAQRGMTLTLDWVEKNGPPSRRPRKLGFGMRLIDMVIRRQLNGEVSHSFSRKGHSAKIVVPLTHERWPNRGARTESFTESFAERFAPQSS